MRNPSMTLLREAVRDEITHAFAVTGHAKPRDIARLVCMTYPDDIHAVGSHLAEDALTDVARRELKKATQDQDVVTQLQLPGLGDHFATGLPTAISIPIAGSDPGDEDSVIYKPLAQATLCEIEAHLTLLSTQIAADTRRHRALKELRDLALAAGATADSLVLATLSASELTKTKVES